MSNQAALWKRYKEYLRIYPTVGMRLDISRMNFPDTFFSEMQSRMAQAFLEMDELEDGAVSNTDEKRMVGHYWLRTPELAPDQKIAEDINAVNSAIQAFAADVFSGKQRTKSGEKFEAVLLIGIGGSALGPQLVFDALRGANGLPTFFLDNTDPEGMSRVYAELGARLKKTLVLVISKSGGTVETRNGALETAHAIGSDFASQFIAITTPGSKLEAQAKSEGWLKTFHLWDWVGGRTSLFSSVGLLPAALGGVDISAFLKGGSAMDALTRVHVPKENPASLLALMWYHAGRGRGEKDMVILPYKDRLTLMSKYLQQLIMESLGKELDRSGKLVNQGIAVYGNKGSTDQHAYVQQLREGVPNFFATFIEVLRDYSADTAPLFVEAGISSGDYLEGFFQGTRNALFEKNRESLTITMETVDAFSMGALIALYERAVGLYASLVNINAYHQPGVEAGKKAATRVIEVQLALLKVLSEKKGPQTAEELAKAIGAGEEAETVYKVLEHLAANPVRGIRREGTAHPDQARYFLK